MKIFRILCLLTFLGYTSLALSQSSTNPLDIEGREPNKELLQDSTFQSFIQESNIENANTERSNPFDVSHIPLKKSEVVPQVKKRSAKRNRNNNRSEVQIIDFLFWVVASLLTFFAGIMFFFREQIFNLIKPLFNLNFLKTMNREFNGGRSPLFFCLYAFFVFNLGVLIYLYLPERSTLYSGFMLYSVIVTSVLGVYLFKHLYLYFIRWVYPLKVPLSHYGFSVVVMNAIAGILIFPTNIMAVLGPENWRYIFLGLGLLIVATLYLIRLIRGFLIGSRESTNNIFHFFLYLCGSEIAPLALVFGLLIHGF